MHSYVSALRSAHFSAKFSITWTLLWYLQVKIGNTVSGCYSFSTSTFTEYLNPALPYRFKWFRDIS